MLLRISKCSESPTLDSGCTKVHWSVLRNGGNHCRNTRMCTENINSLHLCNASEDTRGLCVILLQLQYPSLQLYIPQVYRFSVTEVIKNQFNNYFFRLILISLPTHYHFWRKSNWLPLQNLRWIEIGEYLPIPCDIYLLKPVCNREEQNFSVVWIKGSNSLICH